NTHVTDIGTLFRVLAAALFGGAVALLALAAWTLIQRQRGVTTAAPTSLRREEMRKFALENSPLFRFFLPFISGLSTFVGRLGLDPLRQYVHDPYVRAGYPGGLDDDEVVATGLIVSGILTVALGFIVVALLGPALAWLALLGVPLGFM